MRLFFQQSDGKERLVKEVVNRREAMDEISKFLEERDYKSFYKRINKFPNRLVIDVGSHTEFFILYFDKEEAYNG